MGTFCSGSKAFYERFMQQRPNLKCKEVICCQTCPNYRKEWKYRFCVYVECPYIPDFKTFKESAEE